MDIILEDSRSFAPIETLGDRLKFNIEYTAENVEITRDRINIVLNLKSNKALVNNKEVELAPKPIIKNEDIFVPIRFIAESLGENIIWDSSNYNIIIGKIHEIDIMEDSFTYLNNEHGYSLRFPNSWKDEAIIKTQGGNLYVYDKNSAKQFIKDGHEEYGPVFEIRFSDYSLTGELTYADDYILDYRQGKYIEALFGGDFQFYPETADSYKKIYDEGIRALGTFRKASKEKAYDKEVDEFWRNLVELPENHKDSDIYWRYIDGTTVKKVD